MNRRILLIEDEPISQDIIRSLLVGQGYAVDVVTDGFSALDRAKAVRYDVALVDYHLPEMDGYALGRLLREQRSDAEGAPVLIGLTADRNGLAARRGADAVFRAILPKPIKPADLFEAIERLCHETVTSGASTMPAPATHEPAGPESARQASVALWRNHGLARHPRAFICPPPAADQAAALGLCFDLVEAEQAEFVLLLERHGINEAVRVAGRQERRLPVIGLSSDHADICDGLFKVDDGGSWQKLAALLGGSPAVPAVVKPIADIPAQVVRIAPLAVAVAPAPVSAEPVPAQAGPAGTQQSHMPHTDIRALILNGVNGPLAALRGTLEAQMRAPSDVLPGIHACADGIAKLDQALLVTGALADFLKSPAVRESEACAFDPSELVENAVAMIRDSMAPGGPQLTCRLDPSLPRQVQGDVHRLSQIVLTLLDDACERHAGGVLTLHLAFSDSDRPQLAFRLAHQPDASGDEISWKRPDAALIAQLRAIRMATLSRLVGLMGGDLAPEGEALFHLTVPATADADADAQARPAGEKAARVLLVDDGATSGQVLTLLLTREGHHVCRVADVEAALFACSGASHDIILFDIAIGTEAQRRSLADVRAFQQARTCVPALVLAAALSEADQAELAGLGIAGTLAKPFSPDALRLAIANGRKAAAATQLAAPVDTAVRDALEAALGQTSVERLTAQLLAQIETLCQGQIEPGDTAGAARLVELSSCAAVLGLAELARVCAAFEPVAAGRGSVASASKALRAALGRVQAALGPHRQAAA